MIAFEKISFNCKMIETYNNPCLWLIAFPSSPFAGSHLENLNFSFMRLADAQQIRNAVDPQKGLQGQPSVTSRVCCHSTTPWSKQVFTGHTGQTITRTTQSQSNSEDLFDQNTKLANTTTTKRRLNSFEMSFRFSDLQNLAPRSWWFPLGTSDKHMTDDRRLMKTITSSWLGKRCVKP